MYKKILVPLDGSEFSEQVLSHVRAISLGCQVPEVMLLIVVKPIDNSELIANMGDDWVRDITKQEHATAEGYINKVADDLKKDGIATQPVVLEGSPVHEILEYITNNQIDLVIMGTHGRSGPSRWVLGSATERVSKHSSAPVLIVRTKQSDGQ